MIDSVIREFGPYHFEQTSERIKRHSAERTVAKSRDFHMLVLEALLRRIKAAEDGDLPAGFEVVSIEHAIGQHFFSILSFWCRGEIRKVALDCREDVDEAVERLLADAMVEEPTIISKVSNA